MSTQIDYQTPLSNPAHKAINPWLFVPVLYVMQAMPVTAVREMFLVAWKDLNVANPVIVSWTAILSLPWTLKLFWSPLVDLNSTKRRWTLTMELLITAAFCTLIWSVHLPQYAGDAPRSGFYLTLAMLLFMGCFSSTHDIACDGLYILSLSKQRQAAWIGVQGTAYKLGRLLCVGGLVYLAGKLEDHGWSVTRSWATVFTIAALLYGSGAIYNFFFLPRPEDDKPAVEAAPGENQRDILRTITVVAIGVCLYFLIASTIRIAGDRIYHLVNASRTLSEKPLLPDWTQGTERQDLSLLWVPLGFHYPVVKQYWIWAVALVAILPLIATARSQLRGTAMARAFSSYVGQRGFWAIFLFVMLYRFGEAMVTGTLPLFLKDNPALKGGLGISTADVGLIVGGAGVFGIIFGGIIGGLIVSRWGLRKAFWPLAICMHAPNLLYLAIAVGYHPIHQPGHWQNIGIQDWPLYVAAFVHEFGYGFGFAAYSVFLMDVAQRGNFKTSHYAFGTGLGALCGVFAGIVSAILLASFIGNNCYIAFFTAVCILTIPGMLTLLMIPLGTDQGRNIQPAAGH